MNQELYRSLIQRGRRGLKNPEKPLDQLGEAHVVANHLMTYLTNMDVPEVREVLTEQCEELTGHRSLKKFEEDLEGIREFLRTQLSPRLWDIYFGPPSEPVFFKDSDE